MLSASVNATDTSEFIQEYGFDKWGAKGKEILIDIAKVAARSSGYGISMHIQNYGIDASTAKGQKALIEIAEIASEYMHVGVSEYIQNLSDRHLYRSRSAGCHTYRHQGYSKKQLSKFTLHTKLWFRKIGTRRFASLI